jgi:hypothetical protein
MSDTGDGLTFRFYESEGRPTTATLRLHGGLTGPETTDLLEKRTVRPLREADGALDVDLAAADVTTVAARPLLAPLREPAGRPAVEPVQPVFTRYWLHNLGPAPIGYLPATVHLLRSPGERPPVPPREEQAGGAARDGIARQTPATRPDDGLVRVTVSAAAARPARGTVRLDVPPGLTAAPHPPLDYDLAPGEYAEFEVAVRPDDAYGVGPAMDGGRWWAMAKVSAFGAVHYTETLSL